MQCEKQILRPNLIRPNQFIWGSNTVSVKVPKLKMYRKSILITKADLQNFDSFCKSTASTSNVEVTNIGSTGCTGFTQLIFVRMVMKR